MKAPRKKFKEFPVSLTSVLFTLSVLFFLLFVVLIPLPDLPLILLIIIYIFISVVPFIFAGMTISGIFNNIPSKSSLLYFADISGSAIGALAVITLLPAFGALKSIMMSALIGAVSAVILIYTDKADVKKHKVKTSLAALMIIITSILVFSSSELLMPRDPLKGMHKIVTNTKIDAEIEKSIWSIHGRTDLIRIKGLDNEKIIFTDATAGTYMYDYSSVIESQDNINRFSKDFGAVVPVSLLSDKQRDSSLIIGSGGGREVILSLIGKIKKITAVELNPDIVNLVKEYEDFNDGIYTENKSVEVIVDEGRKYIKENNSSYDLILFSLPVTRTSKSIEAYSLSENYLYTVEAMEEYLDSLTPEGSLVMVAHNYLEVNRLLTTVIKAFENSGYKTEDIMKQLYIISSGKMPTLVVRKYPYSNQETAFIYKYASSSGFTEDSFYLPYMGQFYDYFVKNNDPFIKNYNQDLYLLSTGQKSIDNFISTSNYNYKPVYDNSPFFYNFKKGLPGVFYIFITFFFASLFFVLISLVYPERKTKKRQTRFWGNPELKFFVFIFFAMGVGFMLIEISLFQKFILYLGKPVYTLTVLLFSLLLGVGIGSLVSGFIKINEYKLIVYSALAVSAVSFLYIFSLQHFFTSCLSPALVSFLMLFPLGFFMGVPFPSAVRLMGKKDLSDYIPFMWGLNGITSVTGSALAMTIGMTAGFSSAVINGIILYLLIALYVFPKRKQLG